jgi:hypothetical protein
MLIASGKSCDHFLSQLQPEPGLSARVRLLRERRTRACGRRARGQQLRQRRGSARRHGPVQEPVVAILQGCDQIAGNGYCEDHAYIELGVLSFCCEPCAAEAEKGAAEGVCDFMAVVNGCQDAEAITAMHSDEINRVCDNACSLSIMNNWEPWPMRRPALASSRAVRTI